ncbi:unnamed protein product [Polarella glacialis]|uniref:Biotin carboxylase C-terminal domain-containing protein n=1 Tax=Polarella glacialis TaxID=89957 RepID=A0A813EUG2_POLGL|nr:unnamed protein product [Polarella glacialis]
MRLVRLDEEINEAYERCVSEATTAFGNGAVFLEEFLDEVRHIEVQIVADGHGGVKHLYERDCSVQLRSQKVVEVAPARMHPGLRERILDCVVNLARKANYRRVGTVEFMVAGPRSALCLHGGENPRIQVEHTITEEVTNVDIVKTQLGIAGGSKLEDLGLPGGPGNALSPLRSFSIQCRVSLAPGGGSTVADYSEPYGEGVRIDAALYQGGSPSMHYDPLVGKPICFASGEGIESSPSQIGEEAFQACRERTIAAFDAYQITGVNTNKDTLKGILAHPGFVTNEVLLSFDS